ncbi:hypothetical protein D3C87_1894450 [compost metagenome]
MNTDSHQVARLGNVGAGAFDRQEIRHGPVAAIDPDQNHAVTAPELDIIDTPERAFDRGSRSGGLQPYLLGAQHDGCLACLEPRLDHQ